MTSDNVRALTSRLLRTDLVVLPVRHHSPACAWHVSAAIRELSPSVVLIEGPRSFTPLIPLLTHPEARMPLAVYTYAVASGDRRWASYYPFCDYSPELVALREARARQLPAEFIDLDHVEQSLVTEAGAVHQSVDGEGGGRSLLEEHHFDRSRRLQALAESLGCRDHEDLWEQLFEADATLTSREEHVARLAAYCLLARRDTTPEELTAEGTTAREAEMAWHVGEALSRRRPGDGPVLVVLGGFHAVALPDLLDQAPERPVVDRTGFVVGQALIRFTFERLERLNGYASGMTSPAWHQRLWHLMTDDPTDAGLGSRATAALETLLDVAAELRSRHEMPLPFPAVAASYEQTRRLADLRGRPGPLRSDLVDAMTSCFVKGDVDLEGALVLEAARRVLTGTAVGRVPPGSGTPPLVADTLERLRHQRIEVDDPIPRTYSLDIYRRRDHRTTSRLLHGLGLLGVPFARRLAGPDFASGAGLHRVQERWTTAWSPAAEGALVESAVYGSTLPEAVATAFTQRLKRAEDLGVTSRRATGLLIQACTLGLHQHADLALGLVRRIVAEDPSFEDVASSLIQLALLREGREPLEASGLVGLDELLAAAYIRVTYLGRQLPDAPADSTATLAALSSLRELLTGAAGVGLDADLFWECVSGLLDHPARLLAGGCVGLLYTDARVTTVDLSRLVSGHLGGTVPASDAVDFLCGLLLTAREAAWQELDLLHTVDARLASWDRQTFVTHLPHLRLAFSSLTPSETDRVAAGVAGLHRREVGSPRRRDLSEADLVRHLTVSAAVQEGLVRHGLSAWTTP